MAVTLILLLGLFALLCYGPSGTEQRSREWQNDPQCGSPKFKPATNGRIVGGANARPHSWPWQAVYKCRNHRRSVKCGGSLISKRWIITAAHCAPTPADELIAEQDCTVLLGKHHFFENEVTQQTGVISEIFIHEDYVTGQPLLGNDIALVKLKNEISYNEYILPICLPFGLPEATSQSNCYATGWGRFETGRTENAPELKQLSMPIADAASLCHIRAQHTNAFVCAGNWQRGENLCRGDSGGPVACKESNDKWYLRGVASLADTPCQSYTIFTNVNFFKEWMERKITSD